MLTNPGDPLDYLEVIGRGQPLAHASAPFIAIPTTAGTGSEVTRNAVLASPEHRVKASLRSAAMLPRLAVVDPELTFGLPPAVTASTGLDALTQLIEPYVSLARQPHDRPVLRGRHAPRRALRCARRLGQWRRSARRATDMALASLLGGLALANAGLGAVHGFAAPIGGMFPRAARRGLRGAAAARHGSQPSGAARARSGKPTPCTATTKSRACSPAPARHGRRRRAMVAQLAPPAKFRRCAPMASRQRTSRSSWKRPRRPAA